MKLQQPLTGEYDPATKVLKISGKNSLSKNSSVEFSIVDPNVFFAWIIGVLHEKEHKSGNAGKAMIANTFGFGLHSDGRNTTLSITIGVDKMELSFLAPIHTTAPERIAAIQAHLSEALKEMGHSEAATRQ